MAVEFPEARSLLMSLMPSLCGESVSFEEAVPEDAFVECDMLEENEIRVMEFLHVKAALNQQNGMSFFR